jgi:hypothetical protein
MRTQAGYPLPSYRSLCSNVEALQMAPGIQHDLMKLLQMKVTNMAEIDRDCALVVDEVQLQPKIDYDKGTKQLLGYVSPEFQSAQQPAEVACHALVFMIKGLHVPYKQIVAWFLTGRSTVGQLWKVTQSVIQELYNRSLMVRVVVSDMGTSNTGMWRAAGLNINDDSEQCSVPHPCDESSKLYFMPDVPHVVKCMRNCLETQTLLLPEDTVAKHSLPCREVSMKPVEELIQIQEVFKIKLVKGLSRINAHPGQYGKMKVGNAMKVFSHTRRLTQDALENLFSQIRGIGDSHPSAVQFRQHLKLITLSQITDVPKCICMIPTIRPI